MFSDKKKGHSMKPIIGILTEVDENLVTSVKKNYISAIERSGGLPLVLPYVEDDAILDGIVNACHGFFFTGGKDIDPAIYGEVKKKTCDETQPYRDDLEFRAFKKIFDSGKPILAVCRGAQLVNIALGGTLYQDIPTEVNTELVHRQTEGEFEYSHDVNIKADTPLYTLIGAERIKSNSFHHQAIKKIGEGLKVMATADDGIVEAVYYGGQRYLRAYQWHPERLYCADEFNRSIFYDFINNCALCGKEVYNEFNG